MEGFLKKIAKVKDTKALISVMEGSTDPWVQAKNVVTEAIAIKKFSRSEGKCALVFAACWIAEQYSQLREQNEILHNKVECLDVLYGDMREQKESLECDINALKKELETVKVSAQNAAAMSVSNQLVVAENKLLKMENMQLSDRLKAAESHVVSASDEADNAKSVVSVPEVQNNETCSNVANICNFETNFKDLAPFRKSKYVKCFSCGHLGHIAKHCRFSGREPEKRDNRRNCFACGQCGHIARYCPGHKRKHLKCCYSCGETGHIARYCITLKSEILDPKPQNRPKIEGGVKENSSSRWVFSEGQNGQRKHSHWVSYVHKVQNANLECGNVQLKPQNKGANSENCVQNGEEEIPLGSLSQKRSGVVY